MDGIFQLSKNWGWFLAYGVILVILGLIAISVVTFTTIVSVVFLGALLCIGGIVVFIDSFRSWRNKTSNFVLHLIMAILYLIAGIFLIVNPISAAISITLLLAIFYIVLGIFRILGAISFRLPDWGWRLFGGLVALLLGILILINWPASSLFIIGLFVGIDLLITGWTYISLSIAAKALTSV
jgi:uncharacterized membrane protein HdeD (DUF308 family)